jgi:hypothetical protein
MWVLFAAATLTKLIPLALLPVLILWQRHRSGSAAAWRGAALGLSLVALALIPFAILSPSGTWHIASYHLDRPLQIESTGAAYLLGLHALADTRLQVTSSFGSQGLDGQGPDIIAGISSALLVVVVIAIAVTFWYLLRRARPPVDERLAVAAVAATTAALLAGGKVLSPQFLIWLLPVAFLVTGRPGWTVFAVAVGAMVLTQAYFPDRYWDLVALDSGPIALLVVRDLALIALVALAWPRPGVAARPSRLLPPRSTPVSTETAERAVAARYLMD